MVNGESTLAALLLCASAGKAVRIHAKRDKGKGAKNIYYLKLITLLTIVNRP